MSLNQATSVSHIPSSTILSMSINHVLFYLRSSCAVVLCTGDPVGSAVRSANPSLSSDAVPQDLEIIQVVCMLLCVEICFETESVQIFTKSEYW
jgi:hypothetical protein